MAYRPEWDAQEGSFQNPFGGRGRAGWSATKVILVALVGVFLLSMLFDSKPNPILSFLGLRFQNAWQIFPFFSYVFVHDTYDIFHILMNGLMFWFLGSDLEVSLGRRRFLGLFFGAAAFGGLMHLLTQAVLYPVAGANLIGASGGVLGLVFYVAWATPKRTFIFYIVPITARTLAYIYLVINIFPVLQGGASGVAHFCHLGGALFGYLFWKFHWDPFRSVSGMRDSMKQRSSARSQQREVDADAEMDRILEKINTHGLPSLSRSEKRFLDERSKRIRERQGR